MWIFTQSCILPQFLIVIFYFQYLNSVLAPVDGFYVYYRMTSSAGDYVKATIEGENTRAFIITHLLPDNAYDIKLQAFTVGAASDFSAILTHKTLSESYTQRSYLTSLLILMTCSTVLLTRLTKRSVLLHYPKHLVSKTGLSLFKTNLV